jgi:hypothetical protein
MITIDQLQKELWYIPFPDQISKDMGMTLADATTKIQIYMDNFARSEKTKGVQLFQRFYDNEMELFQKFRILNADKKNLKNPEFHAVGEKVQAKLWNLEHILTDKMIKRDTDRTVTAFYDHARLFFPLLDSVGIED